MDIQELKQEMILLREEINKLTKTCGRMDDHISFVETTYNVVRSPLSTLIRCIGSSRNDYRPLPLKDDSNTNK